MAHQPFIRHLTRIAALLGLLVLPSCLDREGLPPAEVSPERISEIEHYDRSERVRTSVSEPSCIYRIAAIVNGWRTGWKEEWNTAVAYPHYLAFLEGSAVVLELELGSNGAYAKGDGLGGTARRSLWLTPRQSSELLEAVRSCEGPSPRLAIRSGA